MSSWDEYYALLSRAVTGLDRDAYAARGAVYDREHKALLRRLFGPDCYLSDAEIDEEQWAFREAIRRIEFGDEPDFVPLVPRRAFAHESVGAPSPPIPNFAPERDPPTQPDQPPPQRAARKADWLQRDVPRDVAPEVPARPIVPASAVAAGVVPDPSPPEALPDTLEAPSEPDKILSPPRRSVFRRVAGRILLALLLIVVGTIAYAHMVGQIKLPWLTDVVGPQFKLSSVPTSDRAILFDGELSDDPDERNIGKVIWRSSLEPGGPDGVSVAVLHLDATVPQRRFVMSLSMRPEAGDSAMSHLLELRFLRPDRQPDDTIANISGILTRVTELGGGRAMLAGSVIKVAPGVFLFGLAGGQGIRERSLRQLKDMRWLDIPVSYSNGAKGVIAIEKAGKAEQVVNDVLAKWEG